MENFNEFDTLETVPQKDTGSIISHAFNLYKKGFGYAMLLIVVTVVGGYILSYIAELISGFNSNDANAYMRGGNGDFSSFLSLPGLYTYLALSTILGLFIYPINAGFLYILNKLNFNERVEISDLFIGYRQNLLQLVLYGLLTSLIIYVAVALCFIPVIFIASFFFLALPIVFFENATAVDGLKKSFEIVKSNYWALWVVAIVTYLITISGLVLCIIGVVITVPFVYAGMYSAYCAYCGAPRPVVAKQ